MKPSKAARELAEAASNWLKEDDPQDELTDAGILGLASLIDAHPMVRRLVDEQLWGKSNQECSACLNSVPGQHEVDCIITNWQPQPEKEEGLSS